MTGRALRPSRTGVIGSVGLGGGVLLGSRSIGLDLQWWLVGVVVVLAVFGAFLPGPANQLTLARAYLAVPAYLAALHVGTYGWLAGLVVLAAVTDVLDGTLARVTASQSVLGAGLDPVVDGLFYGAVGAGLALGGAVPLWLGAVVIARYALPAVVGALLLRGRVIADLRHTPMGQVSTTVIALVLGGCALFRVLGGPATLLAEVGSVAIPIVTVATFANLALVGRRLRVADR